MGDSGRGLFHVPGLEHMADKIELDIFEQRQVGNDRRLRAKIMSS